MARRRLPPPKRRQRRLIRQPPLKDTRLRPQQIRLLANRLAGDAVLLPQKAKLPQQARPKRLHAPPWLGRRRPQAVPPRPLPAPLLPRTRLRLIGRANAIPAQLVGLLKATLRARRPRLSARRPPADKPPYTLNRNPQKLVTRVAKPPVANPPLLVRAEKAWAPVARRKAKLAKKRKATPPPP